MNLRGKLFLLVFLLTLALGGVWPRTLPAITPATAKLAVEGIEFVYQDKLELALETFRKMYDTEPTTFIGDFYQCFTYELYMDEYKSTAYDSIFTYLSDRGIAVGETLLKQSPTGENYLYLGGVYGVRGSRKGQFGDWWGAFKDGKKAYSLLKDCVNVDPNQQDAWYGIGLYHFWKSHKLRYLSWMPFISDQREEGRNQLRQAMENAAFAREASRNALFRIHMEEKEYKAVLPLAREFGEKYPGDVFHRWYLGFALAYLNRWDDAIVCFKENLQLLQDREHGLEAEVICWYWIARCQYEMHGASQESLDWLHKITVNAPLVDTRLFYYEEYLEKTEELKETITKELE
jgi:tetratricopeptide (TPR) repeat protein